MAACCRQATAAIMQSIRPQGVMPACPALAVNSHGAVEVGDHIEAVQVEPQQKTAQISLAGIAACPGEHFHDHRLGDGDRAIGRDEFREAPVGRAPGGPVVFDPGRGVCQDHALP